MHLSPTLILVILNVGASLYAWNNQDIYRKWMMTPYKVHRENQYYRFITSGFIHGDWMHLLFNMIALYSFGKNLEYYIYKDLTVITGIDYRVYYFAMYGMALVISDVPTYLKQKNNPGYNSLGASGAVSAVIFACIILDPFHPVYGFPGFITGSLYLIFTYIASQKRVDGINHDAHFFGAVFGILFIILINPAIGLRFLEQISQWDLFR